jgi:hypothetical protein
MAEAREALVKLQQDTTVPPDKLKEQELNAAIAEAKHASLLATLKAEQLEDENRKDTGEWTAAATEAAGGQRRAAVLEAKLKLHAAQVTETEAGRKTHDLAQAAAKEASASSKDPEKALKDLEAAQKKTSDAEKALADAQKDIEVVSTAYKPRAMDTYPASSTGRRLAFARWMADRANPLAARVAMNHVWLRHFGQGIVPTPADFGRNGRAPSHPQLLDWLASEFMARDWSLKAMHRLMVTSRTYRMASTPSEAKARLDPDNIYLWRMNSRRMEAELVRDNLLYVSGDLDPAMGGPDIDHQQGLVSRRRSLYLRSAAEKEVEFLKIFDGPSVTECYLRRPTVVPQQALALANSALTQLQARRLAKIISAETGDHDDQFIASAFQRILARSATSRETETCRDFLATKARLSTSERSRENLVLVLFNHNDFITIR